MERERKTGKEILDGVMKSLSSGPKAINDVAQEAGITWESSKNYLEILKGLGFAGEKKIGKKRVFSVKRGLIETGTGRKDTLFGIPIIKEDEIQINYLFMKIREAWIRKTGTAPGKTQVQKAIANVDKQCNLELPVVWYLYGMTCLKMYDPSEDYGQNQAGDEKVDECVESVVSELSKFKNTWELRINQYKNNPLYMAKEEIIRALARDKFDKDSTNRITRFLMSLIASVPRNDKIGDEVAEITAEFSGTLIQALNFKEASSLRMDMISAFEDLWKFIACYCLYDSLSKNPKYGQGNIFDYVKQNYDSQLFFIKEHVLNLEELTKEPEPDDETYRKLKALQGSAKGKELKPLTKEERKKLFEELGSEKKSAELFRKSGLDNV